MSKVYADKIEPRDSSMDVTIGTSTNTVTLAGNDIRVNTVKDTGGNTLWVSDGAGNITSGNSALVGSLKLLSTTVATNTTSVNFTSALIHSTYDAYLFKYINWNPRDNNAYLKFNGSVDGGSTWAIKTTSHHKAYHDTSDDSTNVYYVPSWDIAQNTAGVALFVGTGSDADECSNGELWLYAPSSTNRSIPTSPFFSLPNAAVAKIS